MLVFGQDLAMQKRQDALSHANASSLLSRQRQASTEFCTSHRGSHVDEVDGKCRDMIPAKG